MLVFLCRRRRPTKVKNPPGQFFTFHVYCALSAFVYFPVCRMKKIFRYYDHHNRIMCFIHCNKFALSTCAKARSRLPRGRARGHPENLCFLASLLCWKKQKDIGIRFRFEWFVHIYAFLTNFRRFNTSNPLHVKQLHTCRRFC